MAVIEVTSAEQFEELLRKNAKVAVMFTAAWSGRSRAVSPAFEELSEQPTDIVFASVDVDGVAPVAQKYGIRTIPTFILFKDGDKSDDVAGANIPALADKLKMLAV
ncbi:thioredoxin family protein [Streptomyces candidus]|uniref:Thioredoxin n=1 Tax=Streptomyces candidus TaxID=67283 RepID=A0A7X0HKN6_9ACTN|nr:thioredoxin family protein [Streptomyces candidus]MBB6439434.1 thioredoxin 1 [Streptomyces candidus]GHH54751.1 thioredoxin [Streptomyces candidus]